MREKLTFRMAFARAAHACTKRDAQAYLEQFHQPRTTCAVAQRSATKPLYATFARQQQLCNFIGREEEGFATVHQLAEAQTDLATVRDAMEATDEALARKEQEAAYMVDGEM